MASQSQSDGGTTASPASPTSTKTTKTTKDKPIPNTKNKTNSHLNVLQQLQSPDGYYTYLSITKPTPPAIATNSFLQPKPHAPSDNKDDTTSSSTDTPDKDRIKRNFRKLSLRHHPDRPGGDAETFRSLKRAKLVLMDDRLRKEYDLLGLDLEEDQESEDHQEDEDGGEDGGEKAGDTVISHMASATIAALLQVAIKTGLMGIISTILARYKYVLYPTILFLLFTSYRILRAHLNKPPLATRTDICSPILIASAMYIMHTARRHASLTGLDDYFTWRFYFAETAVMSLFIINSLTADKSAPARPSGTACMGYATLSAIVCLWIRGRVWRYTVVIVLELGLALTAVLVFPLMEMVLEEIMREKLKKIGEKVRAYAKILEEDRMKMMSDEDNVGTNIGRGREVEDRGGDVLKKRRGGSNSNSGID